MGWLIDQLLCLLGVVFLLLLFVGLLSPFESLRWWAGWAGKPRKVESILGEGQGAPPADPAAVQIVPAEEPDHFVIYLSGIGVASADGLAPDEADFLKQLRQDLPGAAIITDVFPYSVNNNPLTGERTLMPLWRKMRALQAKNPDNLISMLVINVRNLMQVAVSADPRYGPIYSLGVAEETVRSLARHGYRLPTAEQPGSGKPVYLIGFSGGGQVSVGVAPFLGPMIQAPVYVLSVGGVISDDPGITQVRLLTHFSGEKDVFQKAGDLLWSGRWPVFKWSEWNQARANGRIRTVNMGPMAHNSYGGYYDIRVSLPDGRTHCEATSAAVSAAILENQPA